MVVPAENLPLKVRDLTEWPGGDHSYPAGYAIGRDGRLVLLDGRTLQYLAGLDEHGPLVRAVKSATGRWGWLAEMGAVAVGAACLGVGIPMGAVQWFNGSFTYLPLILLAVAGVIAVGRAGLNEFYPKPYRRGGADASKLQQVSGRGWVAAPPPNSQEHALAETTRRLHDKFTKPAWKRIVNEHPEISIDVDREVLGILGRLQEIGHLRAELGASSGPADPVHAQHEALDRSVLSVARRIEALADYFDQAGHLVQETAELARLERAEQLHGRVLDVTSQDMVDDQLSADPATLGQEITSTRAAIAATVQALEASTSALTASSPISQPRNGRDG